MIEDTLVIDQVSEHRLDFLRRTVAKDATNAEIGHFLELCGKYDLDPFAKEVWLAVSTSQDGKRSVLLMVGRNGLRKIAQRQGMVIDSDVVRAKDEFKVTRTADRTRLIEHAYAESGADLKTSRGQIIGAWAEVVDADGKQRGYFYAPLHEYRPTSERKLKYSPWGSQESVMILAAAERTALAMATPLSGVVAEGELDRGEERKQLAASTGEPEGIPLPPAVEEVLARASTLGHAGLADRGAAEVALGDQPDEFVAEWVQRASATLDGMDVVVDGEVEDA